MKTFSECAKNYNIYEKKNLVETILSQHGKIFLLLKFLKFSILGYKTIFNKIIKYSTNNYNIII